MDCGPDFVKWNHRMKLVMLFARAWFTNTKEVGMSIFPFGNTTLFSSVGDHVDYI